MTQRHVGGAAVLVAATAILSLARALPAQSAADDALAPRVDAGPAKPEPPAGPPPPHTGVKATLKAIPGDFAHLATRDSLAYLAVGSWLTLAAYPFDKDVNVHLQGSQAVHDTFYPGKILGSAAFLAGGTLAVYGIGRATDNRHLSHLGMDLVRAEIETGALTYALKVVVGRPRPNGACCSFPSGHASGTFAAATVLWRHLGYKAALPSYLVASYVALSRLHDNRHYLSDVVFGATLGTIVGRTVTLHGRSHWTLVPVPVEGGFGVSLVRAPG